MATVSPLSLSRRAKSPKKEVKIKESKDLKAFSELLTEVLAQAEPDAKDTAALRKLADVLGNHTAKAPSDKTTPQALNMALFSGCKLQLWHSNATSHFTRLRTDIVVPAEASGDQSVELALASGSIA